MIRFLAFGAVLILLGACASPDEEVRGGAGASAGVGTAGAGLGDAAGVASSDLPPGVAPGSQEDLEVTVGDRVFFEYDSAVLSPTASQTLDRQAAWLQRYPETTVTVEGHTDERGTREYNLALGDRRATAVKNYLGALDVAPSRVLTISYGEERPAVAEGTEDAYAQNRRAVTVVNTVN